MSTEADDYRTFYLPWRQEWQVFTTQKHIYPNGVWLELDNIADLTGKPKATTAFFEDWQKVQWFCWNDGLLGWFCAIAKDNPRLDTIVRKATGAKQWREDETYRYYFKHTLEMPETMTFKEFHRRASHPDETPVLAVTE